MMRVLFRWDYVQNVQVGNLGLGGECCIQIKNGVTKKKFNSMMNGNFDDGSN